MSASEHGRLKVLAHDPIEPFPKVFWGVFAAGVLYVLIVFALTGSHYLVGGH